MVDKIDEITYRAKVISRQRIYRDDDVYVTKGTIVLKPTTNILNADGIKIIKDFTPERDITQYLTVFAKGLVVNGDTVLLLLPNGYYKLLKSRY